MLIAINIISFICAIVSIVGNFMVVKKNKWGLLVWTLTNIFLIPINIYFQNYGLAFQFLIYSAINIYGFFKWNVKESVK